MATTAPPKPGADSAPNTPGWKPELHEIPLDAIDVGGNVRTTPVPDDLEELAASIRVRGVLSPIRVADLGAGRYELVYGQRRLMAARLAGLDRIPAIVDAGAMVADDRAVAQLVENLQRADLNALDTAKAYRAILDHGVTQRELATALGIAQPTIANTLAILKQPEAIQAKVASGELTRSHVEVLAKLPQAEREEVARRVVEHGLSTRDVAAEIDRAAKRASEEDRRRDAQRNRNAALVEGWAEKLAAKKADPATTTLVGWAGILGEGIEALAKRGWIKAKTASRGAEVRWTDPAKGICDCTAFELSYSVNYPKGVETYSPSIRPACISKNHQEAARRADQERMEAEQAKRRAAAEKAAAERDATLAPATTALMTPIPPVKAKLILMALVAGDPHGNGWWNAAAWIKRVTGQPASYDGWMVQLWKAIDGLDHGRLLTEIARVVAERILDAGPDPARGALESLYNAGEQVAAKKAAKAKS